MEHKTKTGKGDRLEHSQLKPFVKDLTNNGVKYFEILNSENALNMHSGLVTLKPGDEIGEHSTEDYEELIIVLSGTGKIKAERMGTKEICEGQTAYNPPNTKHNVINSSNKELKYIFVVSKT